MIRNTPFKKDLPLGRFRLLAVPEDAEEGPAWEVEVSREIDVLELPRERKISLSVPVCYIRPVEYGALQKGSEACQKELRSQAEQIHRLKAGILSLKALASVLGAGFLLTFWQLVFR